MIGLWPWPLRRRSTLCALLTDEDRAGVALAQFGEEAGVLLAHLHSGEEPAAILRVAVLPHLLDAADARQLHRPLFGTALMPAFTQWLVAKGSISNLLVVTLKVGAAALWHPVVGVVLTTPPHPAQSGMVEEAEALVKLYFDKHAERLPRDRLSASLLDTYFDTHSDIDPALRTLARRR